MSKKSNDYEDYLFGDSLIKRTLMAAAFPALIRQVTKEDGVFYEGFLPGFPYSDVDDMEDENECVELLQDMLDDEIEKLVVDGKELPDVESDEELLKEYPEYRIVYLDINVYAEPDEKCSHDCQHCHGDCDDDEDDDEEDYNFEKDRDVYNELNNDEDDDEDDDNDGVDYDDEDYLDDYEEDENDKKLLQKIAPKYMEYKDDD